MYRKLDFVTAVLMKTEVSWDMTPNRLVNTSGVWEEPAAYTIRVIQDETTILRKEAAGYTIRVIQVETTILRKETADYTLRVIQDETTVLRKEAAGSSENLVPT